MNCEHQRRNVTKVTILGKEDRRTIFRADLAFSISCVMAYMQL